MKVVVLGAGVAGSASALSLERAGHDVVLLDRAAGPGPGDADEVFDSWTASGVAQHRQPHNFLGLGRSVLRDRFPDVHAALLAEGATEIDQRRFLGDSPAEPGDEDFSTIACRRPVYDAVLRRAAPEARVAEVTGLHLDRGRVSGVTTDAGVVEADLVVDASGRSSRVRDWLALAGQPQAEPEESPCGLLYYARHYRLRDDAGDPPYLSVLAGPRGDLGYLAFAAFLGDNRTFSVAIMTPPSDKVLRGLRDAEAFERAMALLPGMPAWRDLAEPISPVIPMGHLHNVLFPPLTTPGVIAIGDARCHTNPTFAFGCSMALAQSALLADLATKAGDVSELADAFAAEVDPDLRARWQDVTAEDRDRARVWGGEQVDVTDPGASLPYFLRSVVYRVSLQDPEILRAVLGRVNALDPIGQLAGRQDLLERAKALYDDMSTAIAPPPAREQLLSAVVGG
jgi:2-polyprenyl-6-methoxyphenol hydroxylase-like FAD-dependent oxidoreductase